MLKNGCSLEIGPGLTLMTKNESGKVHPLVRFTLANIKYGGLLAEPERWEAVLLDGAIQSTVSGSAWTYPQMIEVPLQPATVTPAPPATNVPIASN